MTINEHPKDLIMGIDRKIIEEFLRLIKERYPVVDKANFFLETKLDVSGISIAMANQRDFLSHFCTVLTENLTEREQLDQLSAGEEHLRRAVIESYHNALSLKLVVVMRSYKKYIEEVIPYQKIYPNLASAPDINSIKAIIREIEKLQIEARKGKSKNRWNEDWEKGIKTYLEAFLKTENLGDTLEEYISKASQLAPRNVIKKKPLFWVYAGVLSIILNIIFGIIILLYK